MRVILLSLALFVGQAQRADAQLWTAALGGLAGTVSGGYLSVGIVVTRAQFGHYLHEPKDILGWNSAPVLIGGTVGAALGMWEPDRLGTGAVYGAIGTLTGGTIGFAIGNSVSKRPEGKWAGGAIGAGLGMAIGTTLGVLMPNPALDPTGKHKSAVPVSFVIHTK